MSGEVYNLEQMLPALQRMQQRYSCRSFADRPISDEVMAYIEQAALHAASGGNLQPISVIAVKDEARKKELCLLCEDQRFIEEAAVNLIFCMDWHKYAVYAKERRAPFVASSSFAHFMIALEDVMCMAQTVETAAFLCGVGSCYVGSVCNFIADISKFLNLPDRVFPVVMLSLGYPKQPPKRLLPKLEKEMIFCEEAYTDYTVQQITDAFDEKYQGRSLSVPHNKEATDRMFETFRSCLLTTYSMEETEQIIKEVEALGEWNETQRRFGLHYAAAEMIPLGKQMLKELKERHLDAF